MFKEQYIRDNEKLHAKETLLMEIKEKNAHEKMALTPKQKFVRYGAVFAAFALVIAGVFGALYAGRGTNATQEAAVTSADGAQVTIETYDDIYALIENMQSAYGLAAGGVMMESAVRGDTGVASVASDTNTAQEAPMAASATEDASVDYSGTNVQVKGVDEADIVKTDGSYIYYVAGTQLNILKADGANTRLVSSTQLADSEDWWGYNSELFILGDRLVVITQTFNTVWINDANGGYQNSTDQTSAVIYDISNPASPKQVVSLGQSGSYVSSRMIGDYVYIVTSQYVYSPVRDTPVTYIPATTVGKETTLLNPADLYVSGSPQNSAYTVVGSINLKSGANYDSAKAVFGGTGEIYANAEHLLLAISRYDEETLPIAPDQNGKNVQTTNGSSSTDLVLLGLKDGQIERLASGNVPGSLLNQFSMDEYQNVFRVVTTINSWQQRIYTDGVDTYEYDSTNTNALYTLDQNLSVLGKIENLAKDETVQSVRFDGDVGYFVTFRQVDPLFAVDLSDANHPRILDALKIPGFSEYLHLFKDHLLFGLGYNADEDTGRTLGVKMSMFDTTTKTNVKELFTESVDASWTIVGNNHKAILVDGEKNLIAFPADSNYYIYRYDPQKGFELAARVNMSADLSSWNLRGLFIGDNFYVLGDSGVTVISLTDYTVLATIKLG